MYRETRFILLAFVVLVVSSGMTFAVITIDSIQTRNAGAVAADVTFLNFSPDSHGNIPFLTYNVFVVNQDGDGDGNLDDSFTFDLTATTMNPNGVSVWGQGLNISNGAGTNTSFGTLGDLEISVSNVVGTTSGGLSIVFDGFTGVTLASGDGSANVANPSPATHNRAIDVNGTQYVFNNQAAADGFEFLQQPIDFAPASTLTFDNQGEADTTRPGDGTLVVRSLDVQFSAGTAVVVSCDYNADNQCDLTDIDILTANFGGALTFDIDGSGVVDGGDIGAWLIAASLPSNPYLGGTQTFTIGDIDLDGDVDSTDLGQQLNNFGSTTGLPYSAGNLNDDPNVDSTDLGLLLNSFGFTSAASVAAVPEPGMLSMLLLAAMGLIGLARRKG